MIYSLIPDNLTAPKVTGGVDLLAGSELGKLIADETARVRTETVASERRAREDDIARVIDVVLAEQLKAAHEAHWPDAITLQAYQGVMHKFIAWCGELGISHLPAQGSLVAAYLMDTAMKEPLALAEFRQIVKAIRFTHDLSKKFLDEWPITAALNFIASAYQEVEEMKSAKDEDHASH